MAQRSRQKVAPPFRTTHAGLKPGATAKALFRHFVDSTLIFESFGGLPACCRGLHVRAGGRSLGELFANLEC